ncbi:MAG TPA: glycosyltransferase family 39 protein [Streptosporangiaceae bacterium]|jgi:hypothetical protein
MTDTGVSDPEVRRGSDAGPAGRARATWRPVLAVAAIAGVVHLLVAARYGWHRDEFYYVICGRHLAWGYPDQPPLVPLLARLAAGLPGGVLPLRALAIAAQLGCVVLAALLAAEFGGRARAQTLAAAAVAVSPVFVSESVLFGTTVTDQLAWAAVLVLVTWAVRLGTVRAWLPAGVAGGLGLENKDTIGVLLLSVAAGFVVYRRRPARLPGRAAPAGPAAGRAAADPGVGLRCPPARLARRARAPLDPRRRGRRGRGVHRGRRQDLLPGADPDRVVRGRWRSACPRYRSTSRTRCARSTPSRWRRTAGRPSPGRSAAPRLRSRPARRSSPATTARRAR